MLTVYFFPWGCCFSSAETSFVRADLENLVGEPRCGWGGAWVFSSVVRRVDHGVLELVMFVSVRIGGKGVICSGRVKNGLFLGEKANVRRVSTARVRSVALWMKRRRG